MENKKRLIDANVLKALFDVRYDTAFIQERTRGNREQWNGYCTGINWGRNTIAQAPTVDAVEVVRCKECKYAACNPVNLTYACRHPSGLRGFVNEGFYFCPHGEREIE